MNDENVPLRHSCDALLKVRPIIALHFSTFFAFLGPAILDCAFDGTHDGCRNDDRLFESRALVLTAPIYTDPDYMSIVQENKPTAHNYPRCSFACVPLLDFDFEAKPPFVH